MLVKKGINEYEEVIQPLNFFFSPVNDDEDSEKEEEDEEEEYSRKKKGKRARYSESDSEEEDSTWGRRKRFSIRLVFV